MNPLILLIQAVGVGSILGFIFNCLRRRQIIWPDIPHPYIIVVFTIIAFGFQTNHYGFIEFFTTLWEKVHTMVVETETKLAVSRLLTYLAFFGFGFFLASCYKPKTENAN